MIHPDTPIRWLDTHDENVRKNTVAEIFAKFAEHATALSGDTSEITFGDTSTIKVQDWYGWTDLLAITRYSNVPLEAWRKIALMYDEERFIRVTQTELIPVYEHERATRGFHGELKYPYILKNPGKLEVNDRLRVRDVTYPTRQEFSTVYYKEIPNGDKDYAYGIVTKSRFYNANGFHLYGSCVIDNDAAIEWGWK